MPRDPVHTRSTILDAAEALIMEQGFGATAIDRVIARAGVTKGAFFYHFENKAALARALVDRYAESDGRILEDCIGRAEAMSRDPLQQVLILVGLLREMAAGMKGPNPGCLFASFVYEAGLFDEDTLRVAREQMLAWRERLGAKLAEAMERRTPRLPVSAQSLADLLNVIVEGAFIQSRLYKEPGAMADQLGHYRDYLELLFADPA